ITHEINQPLQAVGNYANALSRLLNGQIEQGSDAQECLAGMTAGVQRAGEIIVGLQHFVSKGDGRVRALSVNEIVEETLTLVGFAVRAKQASLRLELCETNPQVEAEKVQLQQVLVNLIVNGCEAMDELPVAERKLTICVVSRPDCVEVVVQDQGPGVDDETAARMFDPFFTTKNDGMGMGLAISATIVESLGGRVRHETPSTGGAAFCCALPILRNGSHHE
ncbi:MAG: ATP-binding protein, partial [Planctomycetales bacterium]